MLDWPWCCHSAPFHFAHVVAFSGSPVVSNSGFSVYSRLQFGFVVQFGSSVHISYSIRSLLTSSVLNDKRGYNGINR